MYKVLVLSGGSTKGFAQLGALHHFRNNISEIDTFVGTSIGAIISYMLILGYPPIAIYLMFQNIKLGEMPSPILFMEDYGLYDENPCITYVRKLTIEKFGKDITFMDLFNLTNKRLFVTGTNVDKGKSIVFNHHSFPDMKVCDALDISSRIPMLFTPIIYEGDRYCDGGVMLSTPLNIINDGYTPILCISVNSIVSKATSFFDYTFSIVDCSMKSIEKSLTVTSNVKMISIKVKNANMFNVDNNERWTMFEHGYNDAVSCDKPIHPMDNKQLYMKKDVQLFINSLSRNKKQMKKFIKHYFPILLFIKQYTLVEKIVTKIVANTNLKHPINRIFSNLSKWILKNRNLSFLRCTLVKPVETSSQHS